MDQFNNLPKDYENFDSEVLDELTSSDVSNSMDKNDSKDLTDKFEKPVEVYSYKPMPFISPQHVHK